MNILTAIFTYFLIWWVLLFAILPLRIEHEAKTPKGGFSGTPKNAHMKYKLKLNSILSAGVLLVLFIIAEVFGVDIQNYFLGAAHETL